MSTDPLAVDPVAPPEAVAGQVVERGPERLRNELQWLVRLPDGRRALLAQLLPELAGDVSLRRRYAGDVERVAAAGAPALAPILATGPSPDPRDPAAAPPWRLRLQPPGTTLDAWLAQRAPAPIDEALALVAELADAIHGVHLAGAVLRDLEPRTIVLGEDRRVWLTDVGLARLNVLSSRSASSLMLESTPYAAPETLRSTVVDARADVYTLGVILWRALTGALPYGDAPTLLRDHHVLPSLAALRDGVPDGVEALLQRCLAEDPERRPESARDVADALRGRATGEALAIVLVTCQSCGETLRAGMRLCLSCGKVAVRYRHTASDSPDGDSLYLLKATEDAEFLRKLRDFFATVGEEVPALDFLIGDVRMYAKDERHRLHVLPARMFADLPPETAQELATMLKASGAKTKRFRQRGLKRRKRWGAIGIVGSVGGIAGSIALIVGGMLGPGLLLLGGSTVALTWGAIARSTAKRFGKPPMARLRAAPAALPASDPLVARLAELLPLAKTPDLRERVAELALLVQRLCDHRAQLPALDAAEVDAVTAPVLPLVEVIAAQVRAIVRADEELAELDEGAMVRALAASEARREPPSRRASLLEGLDRLRALEDQRSTRMQRLLEASSLLRRAVELGLARGDDERAHRAEIAGALAALGGAE